MLPETSGGGPGGGGITGGMICLLNPERTPRALPPLPVRLPPKSPDPMVAPPVTESAPGMGGGALWGGGDAERREEIDWPDEVATKALADLEDTALIELVED